MREKSFSELQKRKKESLMKKNGFVVLEDIKGDIIVKNPKKIFVDNGIKVSIEDLVTTYELCKWLINSKEFKLLMGLSETKQII